MDQKMLFCFTNISAEILLHILGYSFCAKGHILVHFCQMLLLFKALKIACAKSLTALEPKNVVEMAPGPQRSGNLMSVGTIDKIH